MLSGETLASRYLFVPRELRGLFVRKTISCVCAPSHYTYAGVHPARAEVPLQVQKYSGRLYLGCPSGDLSFFVGDSASSAAASAVRAVFRLRIVTEIILIGSMGLSSRVRTLEILTASS